VTHQREPMLQSVTGRGCRAKIRYIFGPVCALAMMFVAACGGSGPAAAAPTAAPAAAVPKPTVAPTAARAATAPQAGEATATYKDKDGFQYQLWISGVTRPTVGNYDRIAPPGTSFVRLAVGLKSLQTDRPSPLPYGGDTYDIPTSQKSGVLPFVMRIPNAPPGPAESTTPSAASDAGVQQLRAAAAAAACSQAGGNLGGSPPECVLKMRTFRATDALAAQNEFTGLLAIWRTNQPINAEWEGSAPVATSTPLSDLELVPNTSIGVTASGSLPLQPKGG
jgi:hypothetical protein